MSGGECQSATKVIPLTNSSAITRRRRDSPKSTVFEFRAPKPKENKQRKKKEERDGMKRTYTKYM